MSSVSRAETNISALEPEKPLRYRTLAAPLTRRPSRCAPPIASASAASRRGRQSVMRRQMRHEPAQRQLVAECPEAADDADRGAGQHGAAPLALPRVNVGEVHFDEGQRDT